MLRLASGEVDEVGSLGAFRELLAERIFPSFQWEYLGAKTDLGVVVDPHPPPPIEHGVALRGARGREDHDAPVAGRIGQRPRFHIMRPWLELARAEQQEGSCHDRERTP